MKEGNAVLLLVLSTLVIITAVSLSTPQKTLQEVTPNPPASLFSGSFSVPAPKAYGGDIRGVAVSGTRAFPGGRAVELGNLRCFTCSCLSEGITSEDRAVASRVCADNCQGQIEKDIVGPCR